MYIYFKAANKAGKAPLLLAVGISKNLKIKA
jgi:hypothetical protein